MESLEDKGAVITGGASGMGRAFADRFARAGARLVLADVEERALTAAVDELRADGATVIGVPTDVAVEADVRALAAEAIDALGTVNVVCLNAGVSGGTGPLHELSTADWQWALGVNLWGIVHGASAFLPHLTAHGDGHVVITASIAGLTSFPNMAPYTVTKHSAVAIAETLFSELRDAGSSVGVSCLCPGIVRTRIIDSDRNRPEELRRPHIPAAPTDQQQAARSAVLEIFEQAKPPHEVADLVHDAIVERRFWVFTDEVYTPMIHERLDAIRDRTDPPGRGTLLDVYFR